MTGSLVSGGLDNDFIFTGLCLSHADVGSITWLEPVSLRDEESGQSIDLNQVSRCVVS